MRGLAGYGNRLAIVIFVLFTGASVVLLLALQAPLTFRIDDWEFVISRPQEGIDGLLEPHYGHLLVVEALIYGVLVETFGLTSAVPFQIVATGLFAGAMALVFVFAARRVGPWLALIVLLPILFMGSASEDLLWSFQLQFFGSMLCGVGAWLVLDRARSSTWLASALLTASVLFSSLGICFLIALAVRMLLESRSWRDRLIVIGAPALIYAGWWLGWGHHAASRITGENLLHTPEYMVKGLAASLASFFGLVDTTYLIGFPLTSSDLRAGPDLGGYILLGVVVGVVAVGMWVRRPAVSRVVPALLLLFCYWGSVGAGAPLLFGAPIASRYQWMGAVLLVILVAEAWRGIRPAPWVLAIAAVVVVFPTQANIRLLFEDADRYRDVSDIERADLAAVEMAADRLDPDVALSTLTPFLLGVDANAYLEAVDAHGSPAYSKAELEDAPESVRAAYDDALANLSESGRDP